MLQVYGSLMPLRVLEEIRFWKTQEREHTQNIRALAEKMEPAYVRLMEEWEAVLGRTEDAAGRFIEAVVRSPAGITPPVKDEIDRLLSVSVAQTEQFVRHWAHILQHSAAIRSNASAVVIVHHIIRESHYFLGVLQAYMHKNEHTAAPVPLSAKSPPPSGAPGPYGMSWHGAAGPAEVFMPGSVGAAPVKETGMTDGPDQSEDVGALPFSGPTSDSDVSASAAAGGSEEPDEQAPQSAPSGGAWGEQGLVAAISSAGSAESDSGQPSDDEFITATQEGVWSRPPFADQSVPIGGHVLPPLPYAYDALEPHIDAKTMMLHHDVHHKTYVDGLNKAEKELQNARRSGDFNLIKHWEREASFNGAGHYLHTIFWNVMSPRGAGKVSGPIALQIDRDFESFQAFKQHFSQAALKVEGNGWAILVWCPRSRRLEILQAEKHQNLSQWDVIPLLPLDVWEHAYYLKYQAGREKYIDAWWNVVHWAHVNDRFTSARRLKWQPF